MHRFLLLVFWVLIQLASFAQQPAFFSIGEKELAHAEIYSLIHSKDGTVYATTDDGLFCYRHGQFHSVPGPSSQKGASLFNLMQNSKGKVFCSNLSGQIFTVGPDSLRLYTTFPPEKIFGGLKFLIDPQDRILASSQSVLRRDGESWTELFNGKWFSTGERIFTLPDGEIYAATFIDTAVYRVSGSGLEKVSLIPKFSHPSWEVAPIAMVQAGDEYGFVTNDGSFLFPSGSPNARVRSSHPIRQLWQFAPDIFWIVNQEKGIQRYEIQDGIIQNGVEIFPEHFISTMAQGPAGSVLLGTFGQGVIVIPNQNSHFFRPLPQDQTLHSLAGDGTGGVYGTSSGGMRFHITKDGTSISVPSGGTKLGACFYTPGIPISPAPFKELFTYSSLSPQYPISLGAVKDVAQIETHTLIVATSIGVGKYGPGLSHLNWAGSPDGWQKLADHTVRFRSLAWDSVNKTLFLASENGLFSMDVSGKKKELIWDEKKVDATWIRVFRGDLWCGTVRDGLLVMKDGKFQQFLSRKNGLGHNSIQKFEFQGDRIFLLHRKGMQISDLSGENIRSLGRSEGIVKGWIRDFSISGEVLWLLMGDQLFRMDTETGEQPLLTKEIRLDSILVNDEVKAPTQLQALSPDENNISFHIRFNDLINQDEVTILSRLSGLGADWEAHPSETEVISYRNLPPGDYVFEMRTLFRGNEGPVVTQGFSIPRPLWQKGWFFVLISLAIAGMALLIYRYYARRQIAAIRQQNELNASKLTAIQSQMNPHFIFNALNSIQDLVLQGDLEKSYSYITKFANLVRSTLAYSEKEMINLEDELQLIQLYLTLEKLRFSDALEFSIDSGGIKPEGIRVPSMLIQPFIENALKHGLLHKEGQGRIEIKFSLEETLLYCTITDNGIGREKAREIRKRQGSGHESFAVSAIQKRFELLGKTFQANVGFTTEDLSENGKPSGTRVHLRIPVQRSL